MDEQEAVGELVMIKSTIWNAYSKEAVAFYFSPVTRPATVLC